MGKEDFKIDLDFDLSKYNYESEGKPSFTLDDILGIPLDDNIVEQGDLNKSDPLEEITVPEVHIPTNNVKSADSELNFVYRESEFSAPSPQPSNSALNVNVDPSEEKDEAIEKAVAFESVGPEPPAVNTAIFDQIKAKEKADEQKVDQSDRKDEITSETVSKEKNTDQLNRTAVKERIKEEQEVLQEDVLEAEDREETLLDLRRLQGKITAKAVVMFLLLMSGCYLALGRISFLRFILPNVIDPDVNPFNYNVALLGLAVVCFLFNISPLFDGLKKAFLARLTADGVAFCLGSACIIYDVYYVLNPEKFAPLMLNFDLVFVLMLLMNLIGKRLLVKHIAANYKLISTEHLKSIVSGPYGVAIDNDVMIETGNGGDVLYASKTKVVADYMSKAFAEQNVNRKTDVFYFVVYIAIVLFGAIMWLFKVMELQKLITLMVAACAISAPVFATWTHTLAMFRLGRFLRMNRTMISGREGATAISDRGVLVVRDTDLIGGSDITLRAMNVREDFDTNEILQYLSALFAKVDGPLNGFFDKMLESNKNQIFIEIKELYYHEQLGYTFVSDDKQFAVGTDEFMRQCRIESPITPASNGSERVYIAIDGQLVGVFSLTYKLSQKTVRSLHLLEDEGVSLAILTSDFNLHETMFNGVVFDPDMITVLSNETSKNCMTLCATCDSCPAEVVTYDDIFGMALGLAGCNKLLSYCERHSVYRITATLFGILVIALLGYLLPSLSFWLPIQILLYQFVWSLPNFCRGLRLKK